jgi:biopolymer transport protein ExbB
LADVLFVGLPSGEVYMMSKLCGWLLVMGVAITLGAGAGLCQEEAATEEPAAEESGAPDTSLAELLRSVETVPEDVEVPEAGFVARMKESGLVELFLKGGPFMYPLLGASIIGVAVIIERALNLARARTDQRKLMKRVLDALHSKGVDAAASEAERTPGPIAAILHAGLRRADRGTDAVERAIETAGTIEMSFLERGLIWLATLATIAPLLGFLGTVSGMIRAFNAIAEAEQVNAKLVASGISEALITTATGLLIAIPIQAFHNFFVSQIDRFIIEMEESAAELADTLVMLDSSRAGKEG